jgi:hypothetical protein
MTSTTPRGGTRYANQVVSCERRGLPLSRSVERKDQSKAATARGPHNGRGLPATAVLRQRLVIGCRLAVVPIPLSALLVVARSQHGFILKAGDANT